MSSSSLLGSLLSSSQTSTSAASAIDLSSLLQAAYGASSAGLNVTSAVASAVYAARAPERLWQADQTTLSTQTNDLTSLNSAVSNLESDLNALNDPLGAMNSLSLSSSQSSIVTGTSTSGAVAGTHSITVTSLAQTASWYSDSVTSSSTALASGSFNIVAGGTTTNITVGSGVNTLSQLAKAINNKGLGVTASVVSDSSGARLSVVSNTSGASGDFSISGITDKTDTTTPFLGFTQALPGQDASLTVDGTPVTSSSNTVSGVLSGVTLNLVSAAKNTPVSITISSNTSAVGSAIQSFVTDYNSIMSGLNSQFAYNTASGTQGDLAGDSTVRSLQQQMLSAITYAASGGGADSTLGAMGISMGNDGTLTINSSKLNSALTNNFAAVQNFFQGGAMNGFAGQLNTQLNSFTDASNGAFTVDLQSIASTNQSLTQQISDFETNYITPLQLNLQSEYSKAEIALQSLPTQQKQLSAELGNNSSSNG